MKFVILAAPRTGSNMLCTLLQSHPDVLCHHEIFNPEGIFTALPLRNSSFSIGSMEDREHAPLEFLKRMWENSLGYNNVGFKMTHRQQPRILEAVCSDTSIHKIILKRKAKLKTYISKLIAERSGVWEDYQEEDAVNRMENKCLPVNVSYKNLKSSIDFNEKFYTELNNRICGPKTELYYEDICKTNQHAQQRLLGALNLSIHPLNVRSREQNPQQINELINNYDSLINELSIHHSDRLLLSELKGVKPV